MADYPKDLKYTKDHEWARIEGNQVTVGITAFAQESLGDVVYVELPEVGTEIKAGQPFGVVESTKAVSELFAPLSGKVVERNDAVVDSPETVNNDPYTAGWMIRVEASNETELASLLDQTAYTQFVEEQGH
ncbi:glycine cleavage system protein GcvH [Vulgatibacter sp.]|uniref:glycine cleavage system protein GcvH n=1 Tax=Vulgatibacter sp. TaxID=1971226 RepID=UPI003566A086